LSEPREDYSEISKVVLKSSRENHNIVNIYIGKFLLCSEDCIYYILDIGNRIVIAYYSTIESLLALIAGYYKLVLVLSSDSLLKEE
jgi:hypothetical protein